ncbi:ABZJ_00895 family protein [Vannielia litorea]|uniref:ABZJ_00895 family protein n=1 Tax=Vannielia litorea TaxID=1217970 RepID=UPI001BD18094|nr:ABZJ_00895 family protein [Vannielia litorea]MBS8226243.1 hypothetical protein [Vannielia litorea]
MRANLFRYAGVYIAVALTLSLVTWLLAAFAGFSLPTGLSTVLPPILAALVEGQCVARATRAPLVGSEAWGTALRMTAVVAAINLVVLIGALLFSPELNNPQALGIIGGVFVVLLVLVLLVNRVFYAMGVKSQLKALEAGK